MENKEKRNCVVEGEDAETMRGTGIREKRKWEKKTLNQ